MKRLILPLGLALVSAGTLRADFNPVPINPGSFNFDVIIENTGPTPVIPGGATDASMDQGTGNGNDTWNEQGFFLQDTTVGLPPAGTTIQATFDANHSYKFAPTYVGKCAILIDSSPFTNADWKLTTPAAYNALSFLTSGGNGGCQFRWTVERQDGTTDTGTAASPDWFFVNINRAWTANGRCNAQSYTLDNWNAPPNPPSDNPRLYSVDVTVPTSSSPVTNINIKFVSSAGGAHSGFLAISGTKTTDPIGVFNPIDGSGYNADIVVEATAPRRWDDPYTPSGVIPPVTATMDGGTNLSTAVVPRLQGDTWFEQGYEVVSNTFGLPHAGTTFTAQDLPDHHYTMPASYAANNAVMLDNSNTTATITLTTPTAFSALSLLAASGGGACNVHVVISFNDLTTEAHDIAIPDWFGNSPVAWDSNGRISVDNGLFDTLNGNNPLLYPVDITAANTVTPISSLSLTYTSGGRGVIFAVSAAAGAVAPLFTTQPQSVGVTQGSPASFTAVASGTPPITYQWEKGTNGVYVELSGQTSTTLSIGGTTAADEADYRSVAANIAGHATSAVAHLTVLSTLPHITVPSDPISAYQPNGGSSPSGEVVAHAIDGLTSKYLNFGANGGAPFRGPVGFIVTPSAGRTFLQVVRLYTANDSTARDPADSVFEGSNDGGATWTLISSNNFTMPDARNAGGTAIDPTTNVVVQLRLVNNTSYSVYRWSVFHVKSDSAANSMQIGEVEMLGTVDTSGYPDITTPPTNTVAYVNSSPSLYVAATGTPAPTFHWQRNGVPLTDGGSISGSTTETLTISSAQFSDAADYRVVVANSLQTVTSAVAHLTIVSTLTDVTLPDDPTTSFGDESAGHWGNRANPTNAIVNIFTTYQNGGSGFSAAAGFPPFVGPVGLTVTPQVGLTLVTGLRIYTGDGNTERDPTDVELYGSNDGGTTWTPIVSSALNLPQARTDAALAVEPINSPMQEVLFGNDTGYTSYKVQFMHTRDDNAANSLQIGQLELLGGPAVTLGSSFSGGQLTLTWSQGTLLEATSLNGPWTPNGGTSPLVITPTGPMKFYKLTIP